MLALRSILAVGGVGGTLVLGPSATAGEVGADEVDRALVGDALAGHLGGADRGRPLLPDGRDGGHGRVLKLLTGRHGGVDGRGGRVCPKN